MASGPLDVPQKWVCASGRKLQSRVSAFVHPSAQFSPQLPHPSAAASGASTSHRFSLNSPSTALAIPPNAAAIPPIPPTAPAYTAPSPPQESAASPVCANLPEPPAPNRDNLLRSPPPTHPAHQSSDERLLASRLPLAWPFQYSHRDRAASNRKQ